MIRFRLTAVWPLATLSGMERTVLTAVLVVLSAVLGQYMPCQSTDAGGEVQKQARRWVTFLEIDERRAQAAVALLKMGRDAVPALVAALDHPDGEVVQRAAIILYYLGPQAAGAVEKLETLSMCQHRQIAEVARYALACVRPSGRILIVANDAHQVLELDVTREVQLTLTEMRSPWDAERLPNGNYLLCGNAPRKAIEITPEGRIVWSFPTRGTPLKVHRLPHGNTLVVDSGRGVLEVDRSGDIVWKYEKVGVRPCDAQRLVNDNTLIVDSSKNVVIEVTREGEIVWSNAPGGNVMSADRLPDGNTLITASGPSRVIEITTRGEVVRKIEGLRGPNDATCMPNGHVLVAERDRVSEFDDEGNRVWSMEVAFPVRVRRH